MTRTDGEKNAAREKVKSVISGAIVGAFALAMGIAISNTLNAVFKSIIIPYLPQGQGNPLGEVYSGVVTVAVFAVILYVVIVVLQRLKWFV